MHLDWESAPGMPNTAPVSLWLPLEITLHPRGREFAMPSKTLSVADESATNIRQCQNLVASFVAGEDIQQPRGLR